MTDLHDAEERDGITAVEAVAFGGVLLVLALLAIVVIAAM